MSKRKTISFTLAGHVFHLENVRYGIHSEETCDYTADLYADGKYLGKASNFGEGGDTDIMPSRKTDFDLLKTVEKDISKEVWLVSKNGHKFHYTLGVIADKILQLDAQYIQEKTQYRQGKTKFRVGIVLPIVYCVEIWANNEREARQLALEVAQRTSLDDWNGDFSKATAKSFSSPTPVHD